MPQSLAKIILHTVFSTKDRRPFLRDKPLREELHRYIGGILTNLDCQPLIIGGVEDHVHILSTLSRTCEVAEMVKEVKRGSSLWLKTKSPDLRDFAWQNGYGVFSIGYSQVEEVQKYIAGQEEHHRKISFQDEFRKFLERYEVKFDERYVWDWFNSFRVDGLFECWPGVAASRQRRAGWFNPVGIKRAQTNLFAIRNFWFLISKGGTKFYFDSNFSNEKR